MAFYAVAGLLASNAASADQVACALWNPSSTHRLWVFEVSYCRSLDSTAGLDIAFTRTSTRGTPGSTITPDADNALDGDADPASGALLDLNLYSVQPTLMTPQIGRGFFNGAAGQSVSRTFGPDGLCVPPGTGLAVFNISSNPVRDGNINFVWWEP